MSSSTLSLDEELYRYFHQIALREHPVQKQLRAQSRSHELSVMQISPEQGQLMGFLIRLIGAKKALEIGTFTGYSALSVALALPADGELTCCELEQKWIDVARPYWDQAEVAEKITVHLGPAVESLQRLIDSGASNTYDFVFIDANKTGYDDYYELSLQLVKPGGLIAVDNVFFSGKVVTLPPKDNAARSIDALNRKIQADERVDLCVIPISDGLTLVRKTSASSSMF